MYNIIQQHVKSPIKTPEGFCHMIFLKLSRDILSKSVIIKVRGGGRQGMGAILQLRKEKADG